MEATAARIFCPTWKRSWGLEIRETEIRSRGSMATMPQPISKNAPKGTRWVTTAVTTAPGTSVSKKVSRARSWAGPTAQQRHRGALFVGPDVRDHKAGRLSHSGQEGNVPVRTADPGGEDLPAGNTPGNGTQSQVKGAVHVAPLDRRFQNGAGRLGGLKGGEGPFGGRAKPSGRYSLFSGIDDRILSAA